MTTEDAISIIDDNYKVFRKLMYSYGKYLPDELENFTRDVAQIFYENFDMTGSKIDWFDCSLHIIEAYY
jgi:hypothetical protein